MSAVSRLHKVLCLVAVLLAAPLSAALAFDPVGLWRFHHTDGSVFYGRLYDNQHATTDYEGGEVGIWRVEGDAVRMMYTDGWDDLLSAVDGGYRKQSWGPDADRCGPPSNENPAEKLSDDPDAPVPE